jgi:hypothetical protein
MPDHFRNLVRHSYLVRGVYYNRISGNARIPAQQGAQLLFVPEYAEKDGILALGEQELIHAAENGRRGIIAPECVYGYDFF